MAKKQDIKVYSLLQKHTKLVPLYIFLGVVSMLLSGFLYNAGYFILLDIRLISFLTLADYYEGTFPFIFMIGLLLASLFPILIYSLEQGIVKDLPKGIWSCFSNLYFLIGTYIWLLYAKLRMLYIRLHLLKIRYKTLTSSVPVRKKEKEITNALLKLEQKWRKASKKLILPTLRQIGELFAGFLIFFIVIILPIWGLKGWIDNLLLFYGIAIIYIFAIVQYIFIKTKKGKLLFYFTIICLAFFLSGFIALTHAWKNDKLSLYIKNNENPFVVLRSINKGFIVQQNKKIYFLPNDSIQYITIKTIFTEENIPETEMKSVKKDVSKSQKENVLDLHSKEEVAIWEIVQPPSFRF